MASNNEIDDIEEKTRLIFECYLEDSLENDKEKKIVDPGTPGIPMDDVTKNDKETYAIIVQKLLDIASKLEIENDPMLSKILNMVNINEGFKSAFKDFSEVAQRILENHISWNAIVYLFRFGYIIARDRLIQGARDFLKYLCQWIIDTFRRFSVFKWILSQGGWDALVETSVNPYVVGAATAATVIAVVAIIGFVWFRSKGAQ